VCPAFAECERRGAILHLHAGDLPQIADQPARELVRPGLPTGGVARHLDRQDQQARRTGLYRCAGGSPLAPAEYSRGDEQHDGHGHRRGERHRQHACRPSRWGFVFRDWRFTPGQFLDGRDELIATPSHRLDGLLQLAAVAQRTACTLHMVAEGGVRHLPTGPDLLEQLFARQHAVAVPDQVDEQIEDLGLDRDGRAARADPVKRGIDDGVAHLIPAALCQHRRPPRGCPGRLQRVFAPRGSALSKD
jgi:hypothetical protein